MAVVIKMTFPSGRYHATPWGRHVNEGAPEWPPSPWRLLRAFIAVWKRTLPEVSDALMKRLLEQLVVPPLFNLPSSSVAHTRHYMPWEKKGPLDRTLVFDTFVSVNREQKLFIGWPDANLDPELATLLRQILSNLTVLGRAETWVEAELVDNTGTAKFSWNCRPADRTEANPLPVFCPDPAGCFASDHYPVFDRKDLQKGKIKPKEYLFDCPPWHLCIDTETIHANRWPTAPGSRWVNYTRPVERRNPNQIRSEKPAPIPVNKKPTTVAQFIIDGTVLPLTIDTISIGHYVRMAAMAQFGYWCKQHAELAERYQRKDDPTRYASKVLAGKDEQAIRLPGPFHAHYWPVSADSDSKRIGRVILFARDGFNSPEIAAFLKLQTLNRGEEAPLRIQLTGTGSSDSLETSILGPSTIWQSVTPFLGHPNIGIRGRSRDLRKGLRREWRRLASQIPEYADVELREIHELTPNEIDSAKLPHPREFQRCRPRKGGRDSYRAAAMYRLVFSQPIRGPLVLGYANHFGMGRFTPSP